ncbi:homeobox protein PKNOX2-like [Gigantopelta aegis]|uniref:homeobox protein PKNOX2-like n=1 Tax=Gigantopelta aegis TaxID=1735272 RepID=UPI001B88DA8E|nr:homeobox protein PKNOX2-like [Gigantopelta aegis]XP_041373354.1 homeobox protein PKNOX2-like [Gigantopelta aegis]
MSVVSQPPTYQEAHMLTHGQPITSCSSSNVDVASVGSTVITVATGTVGSADAETEQTENFKQSIYRHPLFPLMALLFEKCEQASLSSDCPSSDSFDVDIQAFVRHQESERKPFFSDDADLNGLMVNAIQVLRIHLLELEKVTELCKDFCTRYIACLKGKLHSENLLRIDNQYDSDSDTPTTPGPSPMQMSQVMGSGVNGNVVLQQTLPQPTVSMATINQGQIVSGNTVYQMVHTPQGIVAQPIQIQTAPLVQAQVAQSTVIHGSTPLSQIGMVGTPIPNQITQTVTSQPPTSTANLSQNAMAFFEEDDSSGKKKNKRGVLPKQATQVMKSWLFQHIVHPYPTEDEKRQIAGKTNLTLLQVNNWFINARRRILQPMLDASNPDVTKVKKTKPQTRPQQRFWPESIANLQPQLPPPVERQDGSLDESELSNSSQKEVIDASSISQNQQILLPMMTADGQIIQVNTTLGNLQSGSMPILAQVATTMPPVSHKTEMEEVISSASDEG